MVSSYTFAERLYNCSKFKQENNYAKIIKKITVALVNENITNGKDCSVFAVLSEKFTNSYALRKVLSRDSESVEDVLIKYAENLSKFFSKVNINTDVTDYIYRHKINGDILGTTVINNKIYNIDISYNNPVDTFYSLYYYKLNFFLFNQTNELENDGLIYIVSDDTMYHIPYEPNDYTTHRGFLDYNINNRAVRPSHQCLYCSIKNCKPRLINNIDRFII